MYALLTALLFSLAVAQEKVFPASGDNGEAGGIFGLGKGGIGKLNEINSKGAGIAAKGSEAPRPGRAMTNGGSGPFKAGYVTDASLPSHTIYAPKTPPTVKMPVIVWGNGGCIPNGVMFEDFLTEIASYGYLIVATGGASKGLSGLASMLNMKQTKISDLKASIDWVTKGSGKKYGDIDVSKLAVAGQSCGGLEAYATSYHDDRVKRTVLFNSGVIDAEKRYLLKELKAPVAYFLGGPKDVAYANGEADYPLLPAGLPAVKCSLDSGHMGTYMSTGGGKFGKAAVAYFEWQFRDDPKAKLKFTDPNSEGSLVKDHWNVTMKGY